MPPLASASSSTCLGLCDVGKPVPSIGEIELSADERLFVTLDGRVKISMQALSDDGQQWVTLSDICLDVDEARKLCELLLEMVV